MTETRSQAASEAKEQPKAQTSTASKPDASSKSDPSSKSGAKKARQGAKKIGKPNAPLYYLLCFIVGLYFRLRLHTRYDRTAIRGLKGPALIVCPHISNMDFILVALALFPHRPTFVVSEHFMVKPLIRWFLEIMAVIPKKMYCADIRTILSIMRAKEQGHVIVLFPEGRLSCFGHSLNVTEGTAELVKKLGVDVYTITGNGAYKTLPKWGKSGLRPGRIQVDTAKLFDAADLPAMSVSEVGEKLEAAILHDEEATQQNISYRCKSPALGLDGVLYYCPVCGAQFQMETCTADAAAAGAAAPAAHPASASDTSQAEPFTHSEPAPKPASTATASQAGIDTLRCTACGAASRLTPKYRLEPVTAGIPAAGRQPAAVRAPGQDSSQDTGTAQPQPASPANIPFTSINQWYYWQQDQIDLDEPLESETIVAAVGPDGYMDLNAGQGHIRMDREAITFTGQVFGQPLEFTEPTSVVKAFPASVSSHFDLYHKKVLYNMHLTPDSRTVIKWVCYLDKLSGNIR